MVINIMKKHLFRPILIACDAIIARVQDSAGPLCMARSMLGTWDACQMPCVSGRAEMSSVRDATMVREFRRECGILYTV